MCNIVKNKFLISILSNKNLSVEIFHFNLKFVKDTFLCIPFSSSNSFQWKSFFISPCYSFNLSQQTSGTENRNLLES